MQIFSPGRLVHLSIDFVLVSMILAGIKVVTGYEFVAESIAHTDGTISFFKKYLKFGEWLFQSACTRAVNSKSFKRVDWKEMSQSFSLNFLNSSKRMMDDFQQAFDSATGNGRKKIEEL